MLLPPWNQCAGKYFLPIRLLWRYSRKVSMYQSKGKCLHKRTQNKYMTMFHLSHMDCDNCVYPFSRLLLATVAYWIITTYNNNDIMTLIQTFNVSHNKMQTNRKERITFDESSCPSHHMPIHRVFSVTYALTHTHVMHTTHTSSTNVYEVLNRFSNKTAVDVECRDNRLLSHQDKLHIIFICTCAIPYSAIRARVSGPNTLWHFLYLPKRTETPSVEAGKQIYSVTN